MTGKAILLVFLIMKGSPDVIEGSSNLGYSPREQPSWDMCMKRAWFANRSPTPPESDIEKWFWVCETRKEK